MNTAVQAFKKSLSRTDEPEHNMDAFLQIKSQVRHRCGMRILVVKQLSIMSRRVTFIEEGKIRLQRNSVETRLAYKMLSEAINMSFPPVSTNGECTKSL